MYKLVAVAVLSSTLCLSGCVISVGGDDEHGYHSDWQDKEQKNRHAIAQLSPDMGLAAVNALMGTPDFNEYYEKDGDKYQVFYYRTQQMKEDGVTTKDECTPLVFKNSSLVGWGETAYRLMK